MNPAVDVELVRTVQLELRNAAVADRLVLAARPTGCRRRLRAVFARWAPRRVGPVVEAEPCPP
jgi:hypothetical protein